MQNGFGRQGVNFFQQQAGMNRFTPQTTFGQNANRGGAAANNGWQNNRAAPRPENAFQQQSEPAAANNGVQARLGPARTPITAPGKTESPRPLLLRPGQEKNKPQENKNQATSVKKVDAPQEKPPTSGASGPNSGSKPPATAGTVTAPAKATTPDAKKEPTSLMGNAPLMADPPALSRRIGIHPLFAAASSPQQQPSAATPPAKAPADVNQAAAGTKPESAPNKFGQGPSGTGSRFNQNPPNPNTSFPKPDPVKNEEKPNPKPNPVGNQGSSNQDRSFNQSNPPPRNQDGPNQSRFNNQGSRFSQNDRNSSQGGPASEKLGNPGDQGNDKSGGNPPNANQNRSGQETGRFGNQGPNNHNQSGASNNNRFGNQGSNNPGQGGSSGNNRFGNQGSSNDAEDGSPNKSFGTHDDNQSRYGNQGNGRFNQAARDRSNDRGGNNNNKSKSGPNSHGSSSQNDGRSGPPNRDFRRDPGRGSRGGYPQEKLWDRVQEISGVQYDLEPLDMSEKKFNAQSRLFVGSLPRDITLEELKEMFSKYGELGQVYFNKDGAYAFINFDYHVNAEKAMREVNGTPLRGRPIKVRFAAITTGVRVKNLAPTVTNELLFKAFGVFGQVESSRVSVDDRGKPTGDGIIIFTEKKSAVLAFKKCQEESYFITSQLRPVIVEPWETRDDEEGYPEASIPKNDVYKKDRKCGPRFAEPNSFESDYGKRWKQLFDIYKEKRLSLESDLKAEMDALEVKMQLVIHQQETEKLRKELAQREQEALQLQMGLNTFGDPSRPSTQLSAAVDEYGGMGGAGYGGMKRPIDYYDTQGMDPRAQGMDPRAQGMDPRAQGMDPRAQGMDPRAQGMDPRAQALDPRAQGMDPRAQGMDPRAQYDQSRSAYEDYYRGASGGAAYDRGADVSGYGRSAAYDRGGYDRQAMDRPAEQRRSMDPTVAASSELPSADLTAASAVGRAGADMYANQAQQASSYDRKPAVVDPYGTEASAAVASQSAEGAYNRPSSAAASHANPYEGSNQQVTSPYESSMKRSRY